MNIIAITGASGFIGRHLLSELMRIECCRIKVLSRTGRLDFDVPKSGCRLDIIKGDLQDIASLEGFFEGDCIVINLVYLWNAGETENIAVTHNLIEACKTANVKRIIHCSTAAVAGRVLDDLVTESSQCSPVTEYGVTKLKIEDVIISAAQSNIDTVILRPTSVFGPGGNPLKKLATDLMFGNRFRNHLKSCLFGRRRMNLVHVSNVVAAIILLMNHAESFDGGVFIVSDDDYSGNNFADIERLLMRQFHIPFYSFWIPMPLGFLACLLLLLKRNNVNPCCNYSPDKLLALGFRRVIGFEAGLVEYGAWYYEVYNNDE